ncbi:hypothetical protein [Acinetobacter sp.]|uniref:hypothetical protein n=1 Tax=Acinetobacter sp. TaxID=472 RepID=UPI00389071CA
MNLNQAEAIASLYQELIESIDKTKIQLPHKDYPSQNWSLSNLDNIQLEDGQLKFSWSYYSCGSIDREDTYQSLSDFFE